MPANRLKLLIGSVLCVVVMFLLAACSNGTSSTESGIAPTSSNTPASTPVPTTAATANATVVSGSSTSTTAATPPSGPVVINSPTPIPGNGGQGQQIVLQDRTLLITSTAKQKGDDASSVSIILTLTVKNTSNAAIKNQPEFYQIVGSEGDIFGKQSNSSDSFYGSIDANGQRTGTIVFQVPMATANNLRLMYRPEIASETAFAPLSFS